MWRHKSQSFCVNQGDKVEGSNERCQLTSNFDAKNNSRSEAARPFDCHILAPVKQLSNQFFKGVTQLNEALLKFPTFIQRSAGFLVL